MVDGTADQDPEKRIAGFSTDIAPYSATVVAIEDDTTDGIFAEFFAGVRAKRKEIEEWFDSIKKPLNESLRKLNAKQKELCEPLQQLESKITQARAAWLDSKQKLADEEDKKAREEAGDSGVAVMAPQPAKTVSTASGNVTIRKQASWRLSDEHNITARHVTERKLQLTAADPRLKNVPLSCFVLSSSLVAATIKSGHMPEGEHSIEKWDEPVSQLKG